MATTTEVPRPGAEAATQPGAPVTLLGLPPAPEPRRRTTMVVGAVFAVAAGIMLLAGVHASYFAARELATQGGQPWVPDDVQLPNVPLLMAYGSLLLSMFTAQWSLAAIKMGERRQMYIAIGVTLVFGIMFVNGLTFAWSAMELAMGDSVYANSVFLVSGTHLLMVVAAMVVLVVVGFRALGGQYSSRNTEFVTAGVLLWHAAALAGVVVWWSLWFLEGGPGS
jgi:heme/copper-type cytochrome/quinol oxidase subunit 3